MKRSSKQGEQREVTYEDEHRLGRTIDAYLLAPSFAFTWDPIWLLWRLAPEASLKGRRNIETRLLELSETRLRPFLERAELIGELAELSEETFRERLLRFRCYLAEPDDPSEELLNKLRLVIPIVHTLSRFLMDEMSLLELKHGLRPLRKSLALHAPELHTLLYDMAEQMSLVGENSPEDAGKWREEMQQRCAVWLARLHAYWYALLG